MCIIRLYVLKSTTPKKSPVKNNMLSSSKGLSLEIGVNTPIYLDTEYKLHSLTDKCVELEESLLDGTKKICTLEEINDLYKEKIAQLQHELQEALENNKLMERELYTNTSKCTKCTNMKRKQKT